MSYYGNLLNEYENQTRHPYLYTEAEVKSLRDRLADALEKLWMSGL